MTVGSDILCGQGLCLGWGNAANSRHTKCERLVERRQPSLLRAEAAISAKGWRLGFVLGMVRSQKSLSSVPGVKDFHAQPLEEHLK